MKRAGALVLMLAGCAGTVPGPMPLAMTGPVDVVLAGQVFMADLQPGPVLTVSRDPSFGNFEGKLAKDVANSFCVGRNSRLNAQAFGHYVDGVWVFKGGCV